MQEFTDRLEKAKIPDHGFVCIVVNQAPCTDDCTLPLVEATIKPPRGCGKGLTTILWSLCCGTRAGIEQFLDTIKATLGSAAGIDPIAGIAVYPFMDFSIKETFYNAVKAVDHAAFHGPGSRVCFGDISLNISGDRRYELGFMDEAAAEYKKGLASTRTTPTF